MDFKELKNKMNQKGFSLMEILILGSVGLISILAFSSYVTSQRAGAREVVQNIEAAAFQSLVMDVLSDPTACLNNFGGENVNTPALRKAMIRDGSNVVRYDVNTIFRGGNLSLNGIELKVPSPLFLPNGQGEVSMGLILNKRGDFVGSQELQVIIPLQVRVNATRQITHCTAGFNTGGNAMCVDRVQSCASCSLQTVSCPAGYKVTGGGMYDGGMGKGTYYSYPVNPPGGTFGTGGWTCRTNGNNAQRCYAICCL